MQNQQQRVWEVLEKYGVHDLPIDYEKLLTNKKIKIMDYDLGSDVINGLGLESMMQSKIGFSVNSNFGSFVFYKRGISAFEKHHVFAHEFGHFEEGHNDHSLTRVKITPEQEADAEEYVYEMSPTPVLYLAGIRKIDDIQRVTKLDKSAAQTILARISEYRGRVFTDEERRGCKKFDAFVSREHKRKIRNKMRKVWMPMVVGAAAAFIITAAVFLLIPRGSAERMPTAGRPNDSIFSQLPYETQEGALLPGAAPDLVITETTSPSNLQTVYWLDGGEVYHLRRDCQHLRGRKDSLIRSGTIEQSGKERLCKTCG